MGRLRLIALSIMALFCMTMLAGIVFSDELMEIKKGKIKSIDTETNEVVIQDMKKDVTVTLMVEDRDAQEKLKAGKIKVGNKAKVKYTTKDNKNIAPYFKKLPGC